MDLYWPDRPRNLCSYAYFAQWEPEKFTALGGDLDLLVDSGAFTAFTKHRVIDLEAYTRWLKRMAPIVSEAISLDVIGDWKATRRNHEAMEDALDGAVTLLPAWHLGSPVEELHRLCSTYPYVAIGGCVPYARRPKVLMAHLVRAHRIAAEHGTLLHGLGITGRTSMSALPWKSVDSSSYAQVHMFGQIELADANGHRFPITYGEHLTMEQRQLCRIYGLNPSRVESKDYALIGKTGQLGREERKATLLASARASLTQEGFLRRKHDRDLRIYFASGTQEWYFTTLIEAHSLGSPFAALPERQVS